ncbi:hypothetical protein [Streptomyces sp. NBRC 110028]|uniref:hypothetical protein n=1 Tax=Streptomyces sp. NBRC 110028 TaxID=1621260 RepID=UPI00351C2371
MCITVSDRSKDGMGLFLVDATASSRTARPTATGKDVTVITARRWVTQAGSTMTHDPQADRS